MSDNVITKRLSTRDKRLRNAAYLSPEILARDMMIDQSDANIAELKQAIEKMPEGTEKSGLNRKELLRKELLDIYNSMAPIDLGVNSMNSASVQKKDAVPQEKPMIDQVIDFLTNMWSKK